MPNKSSLPPNDQDDRNEEIESILKSFRPSPSQNLYQWAAQERWKGQLPTSRWNNPVIFQRRSLRWVGSLGLILLLIGLSLLTSWGQSYAQTIFQFFQFATSSSRTERVSMTPIPSPDP